MPWRLLTAHENGQILLWHPEHARLSPLLRIGEAGSSCRGVAVLESVGLVVMARHNGELHIFVQPGLDVVPPGSESAAPQALGTHKPRMVRCRIRKEAYMM